MSGRPLVLPADVGKQRPQTADVGAALRPWAWGVMLKQQVGWKGWKAVRVLVEDLPQSSSWNQDEVQTSRLQAAVV